MQSVESEAYAAPLWERSVLSLRRAAGVSRWSAQRGVEQTKALVRAGRQWMRERKAA